SATTHAIAPGHAAVQGRASGTTRPTRVGACVRKSPIAAEHAHLAQAVSAPALEFSWHAEVPGRRSRPGFECGAERGIRVVARLPPWRPAAAHPLAHLGQS